MASQADAPAGIYVRAIRSHWLSVIVVAVATVIAGAIALDRRAEDYEAAADVLITPFSQYDETFTGIGLIRDSGDPTRTAQTAAAVLESREAASMTAERLGAPRDVDSVLAAVEVDPRGESNILAVTATASTPAAAVRLANTFTESALSLRAQSLERELRSRITQYRTRLRGVPENEYSVRDDLARKINQLAAVLADDRDPTLSLSQKAAAATVTGPAPALLLALAGLAGLALGSLAALALEAVNRRIRTEEELLDLYPVPVLARVPPPGRALRRRGFVPPSAMPPPCREAFRTLRLQIQQRPEPRSILITSASAGDGKTTAAASLSAAFAEAGDSVIAIDCDVRRPQLAAALGVRPELGLSALLTSDVDLASALLPCPEAPGVLLLPALQRDAVMLEAVIRQMPDLLAEARSMAQYVVLDTPPLGEVSDALRLTAQVDETVLVARPGHTDRRRFDHTRDLLERGGARPSGLLITGQALAGSAYYGYGERAGSRFQERLIR